MHSRILTADNLAKKGWEHGQYYVLCNQEIETPEHLLGSCSFTAQVMHNVANWLQLQVHSWSQYHGASLASYLNAQLVGVQKKERRNKAGVILYVWWNVWKERNRRIFEGQSMQAIQVAERTKEELQLFRMATQPPGVAQLEPD
uniref:Reverse transcriptase zinc-binding domain-containing protein n=1 Tax=Arundo donax TaxID=35708 RepID=A0A0A9BGB8_ARUDO